MTNETLNQSHYNALVAIANRWNAPSTWEPGTFENEVLVARELAGRIKIAIEGGSSTFRRNDALWLNQQWSLLEKLPKIDADSDAQVAVVVAKLKETEALVRAHASQEKDD